MKLLVLGGAGYIGSHFVDRALENNHQIIVVDNLSTGHRTAIPGDLKFYQIDIRDKQALNQVFAENQIDAVVHFAADSQVPESMTNPLKYFDNNTYGMICLLEAMRDHQVNKLIFSSTAATYGMPERTPIVETDLQQPINPYGESKLQMEKIINWADTADGIKAIALRYFNVAGAKADGSIGEDHQPETHLVPNILQAALGQKDQITMFGDDYDTPDGFNVRDYVHVLDLADAHLLALDYLVKEEKSDQFNLGSANGFSVKEMVEAAKKATGVEIKAEVGPRRPGDPDILVADSSKARRMLNWQPKYESVVDMIETAWNWTKNHPDGYQDK